MGARWGLAGGQLYKTFQRFFAGRSGVQFLGRGKCSLRFVAVDARVKYTHFFLFYWVLVISFLSIGLIFLTISKTISD